MKACAQYFYVYLAAILMVAQHRVVAATQSPPESYRVSLSSDKPDYMLGENVILTFTVESVGSDSFDVEFGGDTRGTTRAVNFDVRVVDTTGNEMPDPEPNQMCFGGFVFPAKVSPDHPHGEKLYLLRYRRIIEPGTYRMTVGHRCGWKIDDRKNWPTASTEIRFRVPTALEATQLVTAMFEKAARPAAPGKPREFVDFTSLQTSIFVAPLSTAARAGNANAIAGLSSIPTKEATRSLIELAENPLTPNAPLVASQLLKRLPPVIYPGSKAPPSPFGSEVWDDGFKEQTVTLGVRWLEQNDPKQIAVGAGILGRVAGQSETKLLLEKLNDALAIVGEARDPLSEIGNYPEPIPNILGAFVAMRTRGWSVSISNAAEQASKLVFLNGYRVKPPPRPDGFEPLVLECLIGKNAILREAALWAIPRPIPDSLKAPVEQALSDPDPGVQRAARITARKKSNLTQAQMENERTLIIQKFNRDPARMLKEMNRLSQTMADDLIIDSDIPRPRGDGEKLK